MEMPGQEHLQEPTGAEELSRRTFLLVLIGASAAFAAGCSPRQEQEIKPDIFAKEPSWRQDFANMPDGRLDPATWNFKLGPENGGGQQVYTDHPENISVRNGAMVITALQQNIEGHPYSSARIDTLGKVDFGFGRLTIRARMPRGVGPHAAGWMRRAPRGNDTTYGEIDIFEHVGVNGARVYMNAHTAQTIGDNSNGLVKNHNGESVPGASDEFIEYGMERTPDGIVFTINGHPAGDRIGAPAATTDEQSWPFTAADRYYLIFDVAVGDNWGGKSGIDNSDPWQLEVEDISFYPMVGAPS